MTPAPSSEHAQGKEARGRILRETFAKAHDIECVTLAFEDLQVGDKFIAWPTPGDNSGHGGFLRGSNLFMKTAPVKQEGLLTFSYNAVRLLDGNHCSMPPALCVLLIR